MSNAKKESPLLAELQMNVAAAVAKAIARAFPPSVEPAPTVHAEIKRAPAVVASPRTPSPGDLGRSVLRTITNLDAAVARELVRRPPPAPEPVDPHTPSAKVSAIVRQVVRGNAR